jgi:hypothetical protein
MVHIVDLVRLTNKNQERQLLSRADGRPNTKQCRPAFVLSTASHTLYKCILARTKAVVVLGVLRRLFTLGISVLFLHVASKEGRRLFVLLGGRLTANCAVNRATSITLRRSTVDTLVLLAAKATEDSFRQRRLGLATLLPPNLGECHAMCCTIRFRAVLLVETGPTFHVILFSIWVYGSLAARNEPTRKKVRHVGACFVG